MIERIGWWIGIVVIALVATITITAVFLALIAIGMAIAHAMLSWLQG